MTGYEGIGVVEVAHNFDLKSWPVTVTLHHVEPDRIFQGLKAQTCSRCGLQPAARGQAYCLECKAAYMREWRKTHPMNAEQRRRDIARSYVAVYLKRGKISRQPCEECGSTIRLEAHHEDYSKPLEIRWLCRVHHLELHSR